MKYKIKNIRTSLLSEAYVPNSVIITSKKPLSVNLIKNKLSKRYGTRINDFVCESVSNKEYYFVFEETYDEHFSHYPVGLICINNTSGKPLNDITLRKITSEDLEEFISSRYTTDFTYEKVSIDDIKKYGIGAGRMHSEDNGNDPATIKFNGKVLGQRGSFTVPFFSYTYPEGSADYWDDMPVDNDWEL